MSMNLVTLLYLVASVCFIQALKGLSHPTTSIRGNLFGMIGMGIAIITTAALIVELSGGKAQGMVTLNDSLMNLVTKKLVAPEEAYAKSVDKSGFEGLLKRAGMDTKFVTAGNAAA